jgi:hypothetical protein
LRWRWKTLFKQNDKLKERSYVKRRRRRRRRRRWKYGDSKGMANSRRDLMSRGFEEEEDEDDEDDGDGGDDDDYDDDRDEILSSNGIKERSYVKRSSSTSLDIRWRWRWRWRWKNLFQTQQRHCMYVHCSDPTTTMQHFPFTITTSPTHHHFS